MDSDLGLDNELDSDQETSDENDTLMWDNLNETLPDSDTDEFSMNQTGLQDSGKVRYTSFVFFFSCFFL